MSINLFCFCNQCDKTSRFIATGELSNNEYSLLECKNGHSIKYFLSLPDYSLFFDHGIDAYNEGNYFEAFTSIYHCWERFISTVSQVILTMKTDSYKLSQSIIKPLQNSSTKIEGGFSLLYGYFFSEPAPTLNRNVREKRNKIIHGTRNPQRDDVEKCAVAVFEFIKNIEIKLYIKEDPYSLINIFALHRESDLINNNILLQSDIDKGLAQLTSEGQHILGTTSYFSGNNAEKMLSFDEMIQRRKSMKLVEDKLSQLNIII